MALEKIGLEAILKDEGFQKGLAAYIKGVDAAVAKTDQAGAEISKSTERVGGAWQAGAKRAGIAMGAMGAAGAALLTKVTMVAARTEELGIVLNTVGRNVGKTTEQMKNYEDGVRSMGITTQASRQAIIQMVQANLDLEKSTELARLAQDAAVIAQLDSSQAFQTLITIIQRGSLVMARTLGLTVDFQGAYKKLADELGTTSGALTQQQKIQARTNEVLAQSVNIAGTYEAAMGSAGKQLRSMSRHIEELQNELGSVLLPLMGQIVGATTDFLKTLREMDPVLKTSVIEFAALASGVLLVGGALTAMAPGIIAVLGILGSAALPLIAITALIAGLAYLVIHLNNVEKASQETAAGILSDADSYEQYARRMKTAGEEARTLSEELYDLADAQRAAGKAVDFLEYQKAAEDLQRYTEETAFHLEQLLELPDAYLSDEEALASFRNGMQDTVKTMDDASLQIIVGTDAVYKWARAAGVGEEEARAFADIMRQLAREQQLANFYTSEGAGAYAEAMRAGRTYGEEVGKTNERQKQATQSAQKLAREIAELAKATGLSTELVRHFKTELGYTDEELQSVADDLQLTGKEMDDLAKKTGLSRERIKELNQTMGQKEIEDYGKALEDAAKATGQTVEEIDSLARSSGWAADDVKAFTGRIEDLEDALGDAKGQLKGFFTALTGALGDVRDANKDLTGSTKDFQQNVSDIRKNVGEDIDKIREKYDEMLPDKTTGEQRMKDAGDAWDEWAHRALGTIDDVVSGDEAGWDARIRKEAEAVGIIQQDNESTYDYMHRVVKAFYENKIPNLINTESTGYQTLMAEKAIARDADIADAQATADEALGIAQQQYNEEQKILRQARNERALLGALQVAEATGQLGEFTRTYWPGAIGDMRASADTFFADWQAGLIDLSDPDIAAAVAGWGTQLLGTLGATKTEFQDNTKEAKIFFDASTKGAQDAKAETDAAKQSLIDLKTEQATLKTEQDRLAMFGEVDPDLEQDLQDVNDQISDIEDQLKDDGPFGTMTDAVEDTIEKIDTWQETLDTIIEGLGTLGDDGVTAVAGVDTSMAAAEVTTGTWHTALDGLTKDVITEFDKIIDQINEMDDSQIDITVNITTTYNPTTSTYAAIEAIHGALDQLPSEVSIDIQMAGITAATMVGEQYGGQLGDAIARAVLGNVAKFKQPWNAPFWLTKRAGPLGQIGSFFAGLYDEQILQPLVDDLDQLNEDIEDTERLLEDQAFIRRLSTEQYLELQNNYNKALEDRNKLEEEYAAAREATLRFERAKANLEILNQQLALVKLMYDLDIDPRGILEGITFGIDAASEDWVAAMAVAMEKLAQAAEDSLRDFLGIHSRSQVMFDIAQQAQAGWFEGWAAPAPRIAAPGGAQTTIHQTNDFSGASISNDYDMAMFQAVIMQTINKNMRGW